MLDQQGGQGREGAGLSSQGAVLGVGRHLEEGRHLGVGRHLEEGRHLEVGRVPVTEEDRLLVAGRHLHVVEAQPVGLDTVGLDILVHELFLC